MSGTSDTERPALGVVLAGGRNTRYDGQAKALEHVGGEAIAQRVVRSLRGVTERVVLVANDVEVYRPLGLETRPDIQPGLGALGGIYTAVVWAEELGCRGAVVAAGDMPFLSSTLLQRLLEGADADGAVVPESDSHRGLEPLCAFYGSGCRPAIEAAIGRADLRVISFYDDVPLCRIPKTEIAKHGDPNVLFLNVNTPADRERAEEIAQRRETAT